MTLQVPIQRVRLLPAPILIHQETTNMTTTNKITRRQMLAGSLGAGAASLLLHGRLWAAETPIDPNRFVLLADIHIAEDPARVARETNPTDKFTEARGQYVALNSRPAGLIVAGDCAYNSGEAGDYRQLHKLVEPIPMPVAFALGNHDHRERFWEAFPRKQPTPVADRHVQVIETPHADWFLLDSLDKTNSTPGRLGAEQLAWLADELDRRPEKPALLVAHHYPLLKDKPEMLKSALLDTEDFYRVILPRKRVKAFLFGHSHRWEHGKVDGLHLVNLAALAWLFDLKQPRGWVDAQLKPDGACLTLQCIDPTHEAHGQPLELAWR